MARVVNRLDGIVSSVGRKSYLDDPEFVKEFLEAVEIMFYPQQAAKLTGIDPQTPNRWFREVNEHINKIHPDLEDCTQLCGDNLAKRTFCVEIKRAQGKFTKENAKQIKVHSTKNWMAAAWLLERTQPDDFGLKQRIEHTGKDGGPITHKLLSVEARQRALEAAQNALTIETEQDEEGIFIPVQSE